MEAGRGPAEKGRPEPGRADKRLVLRFLGRTFGFSWGICAIGLLASWAMARPGTIPHWALLTAACGPSLAALTLLTRGELRSRLSPRLHVPGLACLAAALLLATVLSPGAR